MGVRLRRVDPFAMRDPIVDFFWRIRIWPYPTREQYAQSWDWRCRALSDPPPVSFVAVEDEAIVGHIAIFFRPMHAGGRAVRAGVLANYRLDAAHRGSAVGVQLASAARKLVSAGEIDILIGHGNNAAHAIFLALGDRDLGVMRQFIEVRQWDAVLARYSSAGRWLAPAARAAMGLRKRLLRRGTPDAARELFVRNLSPQEVQCMERGHWRTDQSLSPDVAASYLIDRYLNCPYRHFRVFGIFDGKDGPIQGLAVTEGDKRLYVWECAVNADVISEAQAIGAVENAISTAESISVPLLEHSMGARDLIRNGFFRNPSANSDPSVRNMRWSAHWLPTHPLASLFADSATWKLCYGTFHTAT